MCAFIQGIFKGIPWTSACWKQAGKAVGGGIHWHVEFSYQMSPNVHTKYVLYSKSEWLAYGYLTTVTVIHYTSVKVTPILQR